MNVLSLFVNSYFRLKNYGMPYWVMSPFRRLVRELAYQCLPTYLNKPSRRFQEKCDGLIVSLTSFPSRISYVWQIIECMKRQSLLPEQIILWLSKEQFPDKDSVPESLWKRVDDIFTIRFVEGDIKSHKKYYYVSREFPNNMVFLIDDDIYYDTDIIRRSMKEYIAHNKKCVVCNYGYKIKYSKAGCLPYSKWIPILSRMEGKDLFFGSGGGTLFCPSDLHKDLTNIDLALRLTPLADDIWLNTMALKSKLNKVMLPHGPLLTIKADDSVTLSSINNGLGRNDEQILAVKQFYGDIYNQPMDLDNVVCSL